jgi:sarcosine oxidase gamma subunit
VAELTLTDLSPTPKWRVFSGQDAVRPGTSSGSGDTLVWSVSPGEWTVLGPEPDDSVDLTHVRAMFRLTGDAAVTLMNRVCALDFGNGMFPNGAAARTLFAGVATEIVRDDQGEVASYLLLPSRSYSTYVLDVILDAGTELGLTA